MRSIFVIIFQFVVAVSFAHIALGAPGVQLPRISRLDETNAKLPKGNLVLKKQNDEILAKNQILNREKKELQQENKVLKREMEIACEAFNGNAVEGMRGFLIRLHERMDSLKLFIQEKDARIAFLESEVAKRDDKIVIL